MSPHGHFHGRRPHGFHRPIFGWRRPLLFRPLMGAGWLIGLLPLAILFLALLRHP